MPPVPRTPVLWQRLASVAALLFVVTLSACSLFRSQTHGDDDTDIVTITVVNHNTLDVTLYNVRQGRRERLGDVTAAMSNSFKLPLRRLPGNELQLYADPIGSNRGVTSEVLRLSPGDVVEWTLETDLARSHVMIR
jgi:hypothetical protein